MCFIDYAADARARDVFTHVFDRFSSQQFNNIEQTIRDIFEDESTPFTLYRYYLETMDKESAKIKQIRFSPYDQRINAYFFMLNKISKGGLQCMLESPTLKHCREELQTKTHIFDGILGKL
ncbi:hypothetical protein CPC16_007987 [Podila verticillata]|nr:hypothetical protein CPC16_007987 [Podila verticillata]